MDGNESDSARRGAARTDSSRTDCEQSICGSARRLTCVKLILPRGNRRRRRKVSVSVRFRVSRNLSIAAAGYLISRREILSI